MRIGLLGGVFDPPHRGHTETVDFLLASNLIDTSIIVPSFVQPLKPGVLTPYALRMEMACKAFEGMQKVVVSDIESRLPAPSYTINTVSALESEIGAKLWIIIGYDQAEDIRRWHRYEDLCANASFIIVNRDRKVHTADLSIFRNAVIAENEAIEISSSAIRRMVAEGKDISDFVCGGVADIIKRERLYHEG